MPRPLDQPRPPTDRGRHRGPRRRRAPTQPQPQPTEDAVAVVVRTPTTTYAGVPTCAASTSSTPSVRQKHPRLDHTGAADPRPSRPLDPAGRRRPHPPAPGPRARQRPPPALGTTRDPAKLTPARVRRGFRRLRPTLGTPTSAPKSDTPEPGHPKTPHDHPEPVTQQSRKPHDTQTKI